VGVGMQRPWLAGPGGQRQQAGTDAIGGRGSLWGVASAHSGLW